MEWFLSRDLRAEVEALSLESSLVSALQLVSQVRVVSLRGRDPKSLLPERSEARSNSVLGQEPQVPLTIPCSLWAELRSRHDSYLLPARSQRARLLRSPRFRGERPPGLLPLGRFE